MNLASTPLDSPSQFVHTFLLRLLGVLATGTPAIAQPSPDLLKRLDAIAGAEVRADRSVGMVAAVAEGSETLLLGAYGKADADTGEAMTVDAVVSIGSITKQFTAAAILRLRDRGKLGIDDEVTKWLPDFRTHGHKVTLRHLLGHTSGVADLAAMPDLRRLRMLRNPDLTKDEIYEVVNAHPFQFQPGTMQVYSNAGYWLLGRIIERASGMSYEDYVGRELLAPLGMNRTLFGSQAESLPRCATGHGMRNGSPRCLPRIVHSGTFAAGALHSTVADMTSWSRALHTGKVLSSESYAEMIAPTRLTDGTPTRYGMGVVIATDRSGHPYLGHNGGGFGFSAEARWYLGAELSIVVLTNSEPDSITAVAEQLAAAVLPPHRVAGAFQGDATLLVGTYRGTGRTAGTEMTIHVTVVPSGMAFAFDGVAAEPLLWVEGWTFRRDDSVLVLRRNGDTGPATELRLDTGGEHFVLKKQ